MKIHLPNDLESSIEAVVHRGQFTSIDDAMAEAARLFASPGQPGTAGAKAHGHRGTARSAVRLMARGCRPARSNR